MLSVTQMMTPHPRPTLNRTFLDTQQYSDTSIAQYERVFGRGFISPGGEEASAKLLQELQLTQGLRVLDVGCGIGGEAGSCGLYIKYTCA
jgi:cyclopropane fatty-acyl-phospholipid synthase-like methyltransferase